jgi:DNA-binding PadR family transcriptional regulator
LERRGLLAEQWGLTDTNREAKFYTLTQEGRRALRQQHAEWRKHVNAVSAALAFTRA